MHLLNSWSFCIFYCCWLYTILGPAVNCGLSVLILGFFSPSLLRTLENNRARSSFVWSWCLILQVTCWTSGLLRLALVCMKGIFYRSGLSLIDRGLASFYCSYQGSIWVGFRQSPRSSERTWYYLGPVAEPVTWLLPEELRECHDLVGLWEHRAYFSTLDVKRIGLNYYCCVNCWALEGMDQKPSGCGHIWSVRVHCRERPGKADVTFCKLQRSSQMWLSWFSTLCGT